MFFGIIYTILKDFNDSISLKQCYFKKKIFYKKTMSLQETFIENLKFYRKAEKISQKDLSIALNKGFNYINSIECGASFPPPNVIEEIAGFLKIEPELLFIKKHKEKGQESMLNLKFSDFIKKELTSRIAEEISKFCEELER